ncbi:unnamed protein product, partial [Musa hybrid cultivar]
MGAADRIIKIDIFASEVIAGILITFTRNGQKETKLFGSILGDPHPISLQEDEYLVGVEGSVDTMWEITLVRNLTLTTNKESFGPFGSSGGKPFSI